MVPAVLLSVAIVFEVAATLALGPSERFTRLGPSIVVVGGYGIATVLLTFIVKYIPASVTYAIWSAAGTALIAVIGMTVLDEPVTAVKIVSLALVIGGIVGLNLGGAH
jgi:small multidrug resistance pump